MTTERLRLTVVTHSLSRHAGGLFNSVRRLSQGVAALGLDTAVLGLRDAALEQDRDAWLPLEPRGFDCLGPSFLGFSPALGRDLRARSGDSAVIHLHGLWKFTSATCLRTARATRTPVVVSPRGMLDAWALRQSPLRKRFAAGLYENANLNGAACVHALCEAELEQIRDYGIRKPVAVIPNGVDLPSLDTATNSPVPAAWSGKRICLFLSRVHAKKGLPALIDAFARCDELREEWMIVIAGPSENGHGEALQQRVTEAGLTDHVKLIGPQYGAQKAAWLRAADAFVLPSHSEGLPVAVLEALAYAVPVLITPQCNLPEVPACGAGLSVEPEPAALAEGLTQLLTSPIDERRCMGERGRALVAENYAWPDVAARMVAVYEWAAGRGARPDDVVTT